MKKLPLSLVLLGLVACGGSEDIGGPVTEPAPQAVLVVSGAIQVDGIQIGVESSLEVILSLFEPGEITPREELIWPWTGRYTLSLWREESCDWRLSVTLWDGRVSEALPITETPPSPCSGHIDGPDFWFPH